MFKIGLGRTAKGGGVKMSIVDVNETSYRHFSILPVALNKYRMLSAKIIDAIARIYTDFSDLLQLNAPGLNNCGYRDELVLFFSTICS